MAMARSQWDRDPLLSAGCASAGARALFIAFESPIDAFAAPLGAGAPDR